MSTDAHAVGASRATRALREHLGAYLELDARLTAAGFAAPTVAPFAPTPPAELAHVVRRRTGLGATPLKDLFEVAHGVLGIDVFSVDVPGVDTSTVAYARSVRDDATGTAAVAVTTSHRPVVLRLAVARELGRVLLPSAEEDLLRDQVDAFARELLLPVEVVTDWCADLPAVGLRQLSQLVQAFEVPPPVAAVQLREAGLVDAATCAEWSGLAAVTLATRFGWRSQFDLLVAETTTPRAPQGLVARAVEAYLAGTLGVDEVAHWSGIAAGELELALGTGAADGSGPTEAGAERSAPTGLALGAYVPTPAASALAGHLAANDLVAAVSVLDENWIELWYAVDPTDLRTLMERLPDELLESTDNAYYLRRIIGVDPGARRPRVRGLDGVARVEEVAQVIADLRMAGRPAEAMQHVEPLAELVRSLRGGLVGSSGGRVELWLTQGAITALLAGDLATARSTLLEASRVHRPDRFPFVRREAAAKLALVLVLGSGPTEAAEWIAQARRMPVTDSWVEALVDDTLWLAEYLCALDTLDLARAEELRLEKPSPLDHLEFWGIALQAHVRHLLLTGRRQQARALCDTVAGMGLPLPGSDGWLATMLDDARLMTLASGRLAATAQDDPGSPLGVLAHRVALLAAGQYEAGTVRHPYEAHDARDPRVRLSLRLLRAQSLVGIGRTMEGRSLLAATLADVRSAGLLSVLRHLTPETLDELAATPDGAAVAELVRRHDLPLVRVEPLLSAPLTAGETRVLELLVEGFSRQQIADTLVVSLSTVKSQLRTAYQKLGVSHRDEAVVKLERLGMGR